MYLIYEKQQPKQKYHFFFFNDTATTEIYTLSLHDALPIYLLRRRRGAGARPGIGGPGPDHPCRSEEHTSELQSPCNLVCRLLLEKKKPASRPFPTSLEKPENSNSNRRQQ